MKVLYYDAFSGISGDMNLGAMIDIGVDRDYLLEELKKLNLDKEYEITIKKDSRKGIYGTKVDVILQSHNQFSHQHRNLKDIENIILNSNLNNNVKALSMKIFYKVAAAEAKIHNSTIEEVHFHEVGAVDSIVDIVAAAICFDYLKVDKIMASTIELGGGFVKCQHGLIPVPAPAVLEILKNIPVKSGVVPFETTTPTGAAILSAVVDEFTDNKSFDISKIGYGIGGRDTDIPNVLRVIAGELSEDNKEIESNIDLISNNEIVTTGEVISENNYGVKGTCYVMECNIDDMNPELYEYISDKLFTAGALDVFYTPIIMKKGRPAVKLSVIYKKAIEKAIEQLIFRETTSIGIRKYEAERTVLNRDYIKVSTKYGKVSIKQSYYNGKVVKSKPEYEDCKRLAKENNVSINEVYKETNNIILNKE